MSAAKQSILTVGLLTATILLFACGEPNGGGTPEVVDVEPTKLKAPASPNLAPRWLLLTSDEGTALRYAAGDASATMHLFCAVRSGRLNVNVRAFKPVVSEERLSFGGGGRAVTMVADGRGDLLRGGVTGEIEVPTELAAILAGPLSAGYGAQVVGPLPAPASADRAAFIAACHEGATSSSATKPVIVATSACRTQHSTELAATPVRALGTEPFWTALIDGRCITISTPEDQKGTRIWTRFTASSDRGIWSGVLDGRPFELRTQPAPLPGCSDGMSDRRYALTVTLQVRGEIRRGCAQVLSTTS